MEACMPIVQKWGFHTTQVQQQTATNGCAIYELSLAPLVHGVTLNADDLRAFVNVLQQTNGSKIAKPPIVQRILSYKACRGAVMFNDFLNKHDCTAIIEGMKTCKLPFQCAHGRPSLVPLMRIPQVLYEIE